MANSIHRYNILLKFAHILLPQYHYFYVFEVVSEPHQSRYEADDKASEGKHDASEDPVERENTRTAIHTSGTSGHARQTRVEQIVVVCFTLYNNKIQY